MTFTLSQIAKLQETGKIRGYAVQDKPKGEKIEISAPQTAKRSKFGNSRTERFGIKFASKKEACRFCELLMWQERGIISFLNIQVRFKLSVCDYVADFVYLRDGQVIVEDTKGMRTKEYMIKRKMMLVEKGIEIKES